MQSGNRGSHSNMVYGKDVLRIQKKKNKGIKIKSNLNCKSFGTYVAIHIKCGENYLGQTKTSFSTRLTFMEQIGKNFHQNIVLRTHLMNLLFLSIIT